MGHLQKLVIGITDFLRSEGLVDKTVEHNESLFELGKLYCDRGDLLIAINKLEMARDLFFKNQNFDRYLDCHNMLLRNYAETKQFEKITEAKESLQKLVVEEGFELNAKTYYTLGICSSYNQDYDVALEYFQKSLAIALSEDDKKDICFAINGIAITYYNLDKLQEALKEIYNLQVFFQVLPLQELRLSSQILNANILRKMKKFDQALDILWECYDTLRVNKNMYQYFFLLFCLGKLYKESGEVNLATMYLELAKKSIDPENLIWLSEQVDTQLKELGVTEKDNYDIVFDSSTNSIVEKKKGKVDFKNQFILMDMLRLFIRHPGQVYSKEELVREVWRQEYNPAVHDNKIYVTIKRLRKLIEPEYDKPKYIFRAKNGYYLNKNTSILLQNETSSIERGI